MSTTKPKKSWVMGSLDISDRQSCESAIKAGGYATLVSASIMTIFALIGFFDSPADMRFLYIFNPWLLLDVVFILILGFFVFRKSRIAATVLLIYFMISKAVMWLNVGEVQGFFVSIIFFLLYTNAMRGTFLWHKIYKHEAPALPEQTSV